MEIKAISYKKKSYSLEELRQGSTLNSGQYKTSNDKESAMESSASVAGQNSTMSFTPFLGLFFTCLYAIFYQLSSVIIKRLQYINPCQLSLIRNIAIFTSVLPIAIYQTKDIFGEKGDRVILFLLGFLGSTSNYFQIIAYAYLPLAEASIIMATSPIVIMVMAHILLAEPFGLVQCICLVMTVCGVLLDVKLPELLRNRSGINFDSHYVTGLAASFGYIFFFSLSAVYTRKLKEVHFSIVLMYAGFIGIIENAVINAIFIPFALTECGWDQLLCILFGIFGPISAGFLILAFQVGPAGLGAVQKSSFDILITIAFQIIFFNIYPDLYAICAACLVIAPLSIIGIRNWVLIMPDKSKARRFRWLL